MHSLVCVLSLLSFACALNVPILPNCVYRITGSWKYLGQAYDCVVENQDLIKNPSQTRLVKDFTGDHLESKIHESVTAIWFKNSKCFYFPKNIEKRFVNIKGIGVTGCQLKEITKDDLKPFSKLIHLNLDENNLETILQDLFVFNSKLKFISLKRNQISDIDANVFDDLINQLTELYLSGNVCQLEDAHNDALKANFIISGIQEGSCKKKEEEMLPEEENSACDCKRLTLLEERVDIIENFLGSN